MCEPPGRTRHDGGAPALAPRAARAARPSGRREHPAMPQRHRQPCAAGHGCLAPPRRSCRTHTHPAPCRAQTSRRPRADLEGEPQDRPPTAPSTSAPSRRLPRPERRAALPLPLHSHLGALDHLGGREHLPRHRGGPLLRRAPGAHRRPCRAGGAGPTSSRRHLRLNGTSACPSTAPVATQRRTPRSAATAGPAMREYANPLRR